MDGTYQERHKILVNDIGDLWERAYKDVALTGLENRAALQELLEASLRELGRNPEYFFAVLYMDLNGFKQVNDDPDLGHLIGDKLLKEVARQLQIIVAKKGTVARHGGDEFVVLLNQIEDKQNVLLLADQIVDQLSQPRQFNSKEVQTSPSIGVVYSDSDPSFRVEPHDAEGSEDYGKRLREQALKLIGCGDKAMYRAKKLSKMSVKMQGPARRRGLYRIYEPGRLSDFDFQEYKVVVRNGVGEGRITWPGIGTVGCDFKFTQYTDGDIRIFCLLPDDNEIKEKFSSHRFTEVAGVDFTGKIEQDGVCVVELESSSSNAWLMPLDRKDDVDLICNVITAKLRFQTELPHKVRFYLVNLTLPTAFPSWEKRELIIKAGSTTVHIHPVDDHDEIVKELEVTEGVKVTCFADISINTEKELDVLEKKMHRLGTLLTFLTGNRINWLSYDVLSTSNEILASYCHSASTRGFRENPVRKDISLSSLKWYVEAMYTHFPQAKREWDAHIILDFFAHAKYSNALMEVRGQRLVSCMNLMIDRFVRGNPSGKEMIAEDDKLADLLKLMCKELNIEGLADSEDKSEKDAMLSKAIDEYVFLRKNLMNNGSFGLTFSVPSDPEALQSWGFERYRRLHGIESFVGQFLRAALGSPETSSLMPIFLDGFDDIVNEKGWHYLLISNQSSNEADFEENFPEFD